MTNMRFFDSHRLSFTACLKLCFAILLVMISLFFYYVLSEKQLDSAFNQRYKTRLLTDELRQLSDDLTGMIRLYAATGDAAYLKYYHQIIAIRDGKLPRPASYDSTYWDFVTAGMLPKPAPNDKPIPLLALIKQADFSQQELDILTEALLISDQLTQMELQAVSKLQLIDSSNPTARHDAMMLVFDENYHQQKAEIMKRINQAIQLSEQRTQDAVQKATDWAWLMRMILIGLGSILLLLIWLCEKLFRNTLGASLDTLCLSINRLGDSRFDDLQTVSAYPENSVMSHLAQTQQKLREFETLRKQNQESTHLISKVFSEAQDGIFLTDCKGTVLDINLAYECITGYNRKETLGHYCLMLKSDQHNSDFYAQLWEQIKLEGRWRGEIWNRKKTGELFASMLSFSAVNDNDGNLLCFLGMLTDITQLKLHQQEIEEMAYHDALTLLPNRPLLADRMRQALARIDRNNELMAVICLDLDGFKAVNDTFGHSTGDALLIEVAHRLSSCIRHCDTVARLGGDEFAVLLCEIDSREHCEITLQRILNALVAPYRLGKEPITQVSASIGYTLFPNDNADPDTLLRHADHAMYVAKQAGKNRFHYFDIREDKRIQANWLALARIEKALTDCEFRLYIQPKVSLNTGKTVGAEALIRWLHPIRGIIPPTEFLPLIEHNDIAIDLGEWVISEALNLMQQWHAQGLILPLSVNVGAWQLRQDNFYERLSNIITQFPGLPPGQLEIEIVESAALDDLHKVSSLIAKAKTLGVKFALDDFGTGYSALTYLKRLGVSTLKIDQSFVHDLLTDESDLAIVRGVIGMAKAFNTDIVAEGVENWQQAKCLLAMGCEVAQGFVISHPMPADEVINWVTQFRMPNLQDTCNGP